MSKKILYISYETGLTGPLLHAQIIPHIMNLSKKNHKFYMLLYESRQRNIEEISEFVRIEKKLKKHNVRLWVLNRSSFLPSPLPSIVDVIKGTFFSLYITLFFSVNIIHGRSLIPGIIGFLTSLIVNRKWVFDPRILHAEAGALAGRFKKDSHKYNTIYWLERLLARNADAVRVESEQHRYAYQKEKDISEKEDNYWIIANSTDIIRFHPDEEIRNRMRNDLGIHGNQILFIYSGTFSEGRPNKEMAEFISLASDQIGSIHFLVISYTPKDEIRKILLEYINETNFTIASSKWRDVPQYLCAADFGIVFADPVASRHSVPLKFSEYLASGLPVVINAGLGNTEAIINQYGVGVILDDLSQSSMKEAVIKCKGLLENQGEIRMRCRKAAVEKFTISKAVHEMSKMYESLVSE